MKRSSQPLVLSLFPGIGLLDMAFEEEGFCVVRGPDVLWGGDIRRFHVPEGGFAGVIGGPPCQLFSRLRHVQPLAGKKHGNLIPEFQRIVCEAAPDWFIMENVEDAPLPAVLNYTVHAQLLRDVWVGGASSRIRRISFGSVVGASLRIEQVALHRQDTVLAAYAQGNGRPVPVRMNTGGVVKKSAALNDLQKPGEYWAGMLTAQGLPADFLSEAPFTLQGKKKAVGNGVPLPMGRAIAKAVKRAMYPELVGAA